MEEVEGLFSKSLEEMGELKAWGCYSLAVAQLLLSHCLAIAQPLLSCCLAIAQQFLSCCLAIAQPLLSSSLAVAQLLLSHCFAIVWLLLSRCLAIAQPLLSCYLAMAQPLLIHCLAVAQPRVWGVVCKVLTKCFSHCISFTLIRALGLKSLQSCLKKSNLYSSILSNGILGVKWQMSFMFF